MKRQLAGKTLVTRNEEKWSAELMNVGWTAFPDVILRYQRVLGLDPIDVNILLHLASHWWLAGNLPRPAKGTIAERMGKDPSTIRRRIARLERAGYIKRVARYDPHRGGQRANAYRFDGLIEKAKPYAAEMASQRQRRKAEDTATRKPGLRVVAGRKG